MPNKWVVHEASFLLCIYFGVQSMPCVGYLQSTRIGAGCCTLLYLGVPYLDCLSRSWWYISSSRLFLVFNPVFWWSVSALIRPKRVEVLYPFPFFDFHLLLAACHSLDVQVIHTLLRECSFRILVLTRRISKSGCERKERRCAHCMSGVHERLHLSVFSHHEDSCLTRDMVVEKECVDTFPSPLLSSMGLRKNKSTRSKLYQRFNLESRGYIFQHHKLHRIIHSTTPPSFLSQEHQHDCLFAFFNQSWDRLLWGGAERSWGVEEEGATRWLALPYQNPPRARFGVKIRWLICHCLQPCILLMMYLRYFWFVWVQRCLSLHRRINNYALLATISTEGWHSTDFLWILQKCQSAV